MTDFNSTRWANNEFTQEYRDNADIFIVERKRMIEILVSFYRHFISGNSNISILDLGCGDGILTHHILELNPSISATLIDASEDMLSKAEERLNGFKNVHFINASFQDIMGTSHLLNKYDLIISSLAIHHLDTNGKSGLFKLIFERLNQPGYFINIDTMLSPSHTVEQWYMRLWEDWVKEKKISVGIDGDIFNDITRRYKDADENKPDTLDNQLKILREIGFKEVDCYYKYGIFAIYGGCKQ